MTEMSQVSMDLASFEVVDHCRDVLLGVLEEGLLDIVVCNESEALMFAKVPPLTLATSRPPPVTCGSPAPKPVLAML